MSAISSASPAAASGAPTYERHKPEETTLYKLVQENWLSFKDQVEADAGHPLPDFVIKEFEEYLRCGILAHGFLRAKCEKCNFEMLVAFSCKKRGFCPSCGARRMSETAAHMVDSVLPLKPVRQWVLTFPVPVRLCLAVRPKLMARALEISHSEIANYYRQKANERDAGLTTKTAKAGAVTLIQRFGGSLNVNIHFHQLFIDGCYAIDCDGKPCDFWAGGLPTVPEVAKVLEKIIRRIVRYFEKQGIIAKDEDLQLPIAEDDVFSKLQAGSTTYRFTTGKSKGKKAIVLKSLEDVDHNSGSGLVAKSSGFSLHAGVATRADERDKLERICRYIARPAVSEDRLSVNEKGDVIYRFKKPWDDGTTAIRLTPLELMERLAALVPRPRVHLTRFHGLLAPHYKHRALIVPKPKVTEKHEPPLTADGAAPLPIGEAGVTQTEVFTADPKRISWARLLKRVFKIDVETCPHCKSRVRIIAAIEDPEVIRKILGHLGLATKPPRVHQSRGPPPEAVEPIEFDTSDMVQFHPLFD